MGNVGGRGKWIPSATKNVRVFPTSPLNPSRGNGRTPRDHRVIIFPQRYSPSSKRDANLPFFSHRRFFASFACMQYQLHCPTMDAFPGKLSFFCIGPRAGFLRHCISDRTSPSIQVSWGNNMLDPMSSLLVRSSQSCDQILSCSRRFSWFFIGVSRINTNAG